MTISLKNFKGFGSSYTLAATTTSQNTAVSQPAAVAGTAGFAGGYSDLEVYNGSTGVAFIAYGTSPATATTSSPDFVAPGAIVILNMGMPATNVAIILSSGSGNVYFAVGEGS
jgi:hypothetical protein